MNEEIRNEGFEEVEGEVINEEPANDDEIVTVSVVKKDALPIRFLKKVAPVLTKGALIAGGSYLAGKSAASAVQRYCRLKGLEITVLPAGGTEIVNGILTRIADELHQIELKDVAEKAIGTTKDVVETIVENAVE